MPALRPFAPLLAQPPPPPTSALTMSSPPPSPPRQQHHEEEEEHHEQQHVDEDDDEAAPDLPPPIKDERVTSEVDDDDNRDAEVTLPLLASDNEDGEELLASGISRQTAWSRRVSEGFVAFNKSFDAVEITTDATNPVKKDTTTRGGKVNFSPTTPLKGIGGQSVQLLKIDDLRMFCSRNGIKGSRKAKKADICWAICKAKEAFLEGKAGPYKNLMPPCTDEGTEHQDHVRGGGGNMGGDVVPSIGQIPAAEAWGDEDLDSEQLRANKKRRVEDTTLLHPVSVGGLLPPNLPPPVNGAPATAPPHVQSAAGFTAAVGLYSKQHQEFLHLQRRLVRSKENTNHSIQLRETVESASTLRREIREEKNRRSLLWKQLVENVGDESLATTRVKSFLAAMESGDHPEGGGDVKGSYESLVENVIEQDELIRRMGVQHVAMSVAVDLLLEN